VLQDRRSLIRRAELCASAALILSAALATSAQVPESIVAAQSQALIPAAERKPAADFTLADLHGQELSLSQFRGKVVLLDFWAVDCGGCRIEIPWYVDFDRKYRSLGLVLIGLDMYGETPQKILPFMQQAHMDYPVAVGTDAIGARFNLTAMPLTLLIDRQGRIAVAHAGIVDRPQFESDVRQLLSER
jgi:peroxiredoxin